MVTTWRHFLCEYLSRERGYQKQAPELECGAHDLLAELSQVVPVGTANLLDQAVGAQPFEGTRDLPCALVGQERL